MTGEPVSQEIILTTDEQEQAVFAVWAARTGLDGNALENSGCGCCVDICTVWASAEQVAEPNTSLNAVRS